MVGTLLPVVLGERLMSLHPMPATREESELLTIPKKASILSISRVIMTPEETPIEVACSRYRGDRYKASIRVPTTTIE